MQVTGKKAPQGAFFLGATGTATLASGKSPQPETFAMDWKGNLVSIALGSLLIAGGALIAYAPWSAVRELEDAARRADKGTLEQLVDYHSVGRSLRAQLEGELASVLAEEGQKPDAVVDETRARELIGPAVDLLLQPHGISRLMEGTVAHVPPPGERLSAEAAAPSGAAAGYEDFNRFTVRVTPQQPGARAVLLVMTRQDATRWKLTDVQLPRHAAIARADFAAAALAPPADTGLGISAFDGDCVDLHVAEYRAAHSDRSPPADLLNDWMTECSQ